MPDLEEHNYRILVLGAPGSGKSTLARELSISLKTKAIHLDKYYWKPGWVETTSDVWDLELNELLKEESWIMDGNYINSLSLVKRIEYSTHIVYLDIPWYKSIYRIILRMIKYRNKTRPDMNAGCQERLNIEFIQFILWSIKYNFTYKKNIINILSDAKYKILYNSKSIDNWMRGNFETKPTSPILPYQPSVALHN